MNKGYDELRNTYSLEDWYNVLCRNRPHHKSKLYTEWSNLESIVYEELLDEDENIKECDELIDDIIKFLKKKGDKNVSLHQENGNGKIDIRYVKMLVRD